MSTDNTSADSANDVGDEGDALRPSEALDSDEVRNNDGDDVVDPPERWIEPKEDETLDERLSDEVPDVRRRRTGRRRRHPTAVTSSRSATTNSTTSTRSGTAPTRGRSAAPRRTASRSSTSSNDARRVTRGGRPRPAQSPACSTITARAST